MSACARPLLFLLMALRAIGSDEFVIEFGCAVWDGETVVGVESSADLQGWTFVKALPLSQVITHTNGLRRIPIDADGEVRFYRLWLSNSVSRVESPDFPNRQLLGGNTITGMRIGRNTFEPQTLSRVAPQMNADGTRKNLTEGREGARRSEGKMK